MPLPEMATKRHHSDSDGDSDPDFPLDPKDEALLWRVFHREQSDNRAAENADSLESESDSDLSDIEDPALVERYRELKRGRLDENLTEEEQKRILIASFTDDQMERFEAYRRMTVNKPGVKRICMGVLNHSIPQNISIVLTGISKLFLGEIITRAIEVQQRDNRAKLIADASAAKEAKKKGLEPAHLQYDGDAIMPLLLDHVREAWRLYKLENSSALTPEYRKRDEGDSGIFR